MLSLDISDFSIMSSTFVIMVPMCFVGWLLVADALDTLWFLYFIFGTQMTSIFEGSTPQKQGLNSNQNKGHSGSIYLIYTYRNTYTKHPFKTRGHLPPVIPPSPGGYATVRNWPWRLWTCGACASGIGVPKGSMGSEIQVTCVDVSVPSPPWNTILENPSNHWDLDNCTGIII